MFDIHRVELDWGGRKLVLETGKIARQADGAVVATYGESKVLATVVADQGAAGGHRLPAAHRRLPGEVLRRGPHSRRLFQARRPPDRERDAGLAADRPPDPAAVRRGLAQRDPGDRDDLVARSGERSRHPGDGRGLGRADAFGRSVHGPDRRRARRLHQQRIRAQPAARRDAGEPARPRRRRHAGRRADGRIGSQGADRGRDARRRDVRPPAFPAGDRSHHPARREGREGAARARRCRQRSARKGNARPGRGRPARRLRDPRQDAAPQGGRCRQGEGDGAFLPGGRGEPAASEAAGRRRLQGARSQDRALEHPRHQQAHRRPRLEDGAPDRGRGRRAAARPRLGAVHPRRDPGAGGGDARHRRGRAVDRRPARDLQGNLPAALQLPAILGRRDRPHGRAAPPRDRPRQARLARHPSDAAAEPRVPLHASAWCRRSPSRTARPRWRPSAAPRWR